MYLEAWNVSLSPTNFAYFHKDTGIWLYYYYPYSSSYPYYLENTNIISWIHPDHDLSVTVSHTPTVLANTISTINITVKNNGLVNESDIEIYLYINSNLEMYNSILLIYPDMTITFSYLWNSTVIGWNNITAYVIPKVNESYLFNNINSKLVHVVSPLIEFELGDYFELYYSYGLMYRFSYEYMVDSTHVYISRDSYYYMIVDIVTGYITSGNMWVGYYYPGQIGGNITVGSIINYLSSSGTVTGTVWYDWHGMYLEAWNVSLSSTTYLYYHKDTGIWLYYYYPSSSYPYYMENTNMIAWIQPEHDLSVFVYSNDVLLINTNSSIYITITNHGTSNETNVEFSLFINSISVKNELLNLGRDSNQTIIFVWNTATIGIYNITAYISPVANESYLINNYYTKIVQVFQPLLKFDLGSYIEMYNSYGMLYNFSYDYMTDQTHVHISLTSYYYIIVDILTGYITSGNTWVGYYYPGQIGGNITVGSIVQYLGSYGTVTGTALYDWHGMTLEAWNVTFNSYSFAYYHKDTGIWLYYYYPSSSYPYYMEQTNLIQWKQPDHDLSILMDVPSSISNFLPTSINMTIINKGSSNESNIALYLWINGDLVNNQINIYLQSNETILFSYLWKPSKIGLYNITAYVTNVENESTTLNNIQTEFVSVYFLSNYKMIENEYNWLDAKSNGTSLGISGDDTYGILNLPFDFYFYDRFFSTIYVGSNGWLSFYQSPTSYSHPSFPISTYPYAISLLWQDLIASNNIYVWTTSEFVVIEYNNYYYLGGSLAGTFEVVLYSNGNIVFQYKSIVLDSAATVGLNYGLDLLYYSAYLDGLQGKTEFSLLFTSSDYQFHDLKIDAYNQEIMIVNSSTQLIFTITNYGTYNESDVLVNLWIDNDLAKTETYSLLQAGEMKNFTYTWLASEPKYYNITVYIEPVVNETSLSNNLHSAMINVVKPLLKFTIGSYIEMYNSYGMVYNFTYDYMVDPTHVYISRGSGYYLIVDIVTGYITSGNTWVGYYYPGQISGNITVGSIIRYLGSYGTVTGTALYDWYGMTLEAWNVTFTSYSFAYYHKDTGVWLYYYYPSSSYPYYMEDTNIITWLQPEHDLSVTITTPDIILTNKGINITVIITNRGITDETDVEFQLFIDSLSEYTELISVSSGQTITITVGWKTAINGLHNITAYITPVTDEKYVLNNKFSKFVTAVTPILQFEIGDYVEINYDYGLQYNFTYDHMVDSTHVYIFRDSYYYMIVDIVTGYITGGNTWVGYYYPGQIGGNLSVGSTVRYLNTVGTIIGTAWYDWNGTPLEAWNVSLTSYSYLYYHKETGIWLYYYYSYGYNYHMVNTSMIEPDRTPPQWVVKPDDLTFEMGSTGNSISWIVQDQYPNQYFLYLNNVLTEQGNWTSNKALSFSLDELEVGSYNYTIFFSDMPENKIFDSVIVTVIDTTKPSITEVPDITYEEGQVGNTFSWLLEDLNPYTYTIYVNNKEFIQNTWIINQHVNMTVDKLEAGIYNYTIVAVDLFGNENSDTVMVTVIDTTTPPLVTDNEDIIFENGTTGNIISWLLQDDDPYIYRIFKDGEEVLLANWTINEQVNISLDDLMPGDYNYTIYVEDSHGNSNKDTVLVTVIDITKPPEILSSGDVTVDEESTGNSISWVLKDYDPNNYIIYKDGKNLLSDNWTSGQVIQIFVDGLKHGSYNFTIVVEDTHGNMNADTIWVTVLKNSHTSEESNTSQSTDSTAKKNSPSNNTEILLVVISGAGVTTVTLLYIKKKRK